MFKVLDFGNIPTTYKWKEEFKNNMKLFTYRISIKDFSETKEEIKTNFKITSINDKEAYKVLQIILEDELSSNNIITTEFSIIGGSIYKINSFDEIIPIANFFYEKETKQEGILNKIKSFFK